MNALNSTRAVNRAERKQKNRHKRISHSVTSPFFFCVTSVLSSCHWELWIQVT